MKKEILNKFVSFVPGINTTRAEGKFGKKELDYYEQAAFDKDYTFNNTSTNKIQTENNDNELSLKEGDVIISNSLHLAAMVGKDNIGKIPSINFTKVVFNNNLLDKKYFIYLFNENKNLQRQKEKKMQGNVILRLSNKALSQLVIPVIPLDEQVKIGLIYETKQKLKSQLNNYNDLLDDFTNNILEESLNK